MLSVINHDCSVNCDPKLQYWLMVIYVYLCLLFIVVTSKIAIGVNLSWQNGGWAWKLSSWSEQQDKQEECSRDGAAGASVQPWIDVVERNCHEPWLIMIVPWTATQNYSTDWCLFLQVKNKPWLPWVYSWIQDCREQFIFNLCTGKIRKTTQDKIRTEAAPRKEKA
jgi:hypothetical protein